MACIHPSLEWLHVLLTHHYSYKNAIFLLWQQKIRTISRNVKKFRTKKQIIKIVPKDLKQSVFQRQRTAAEVCGQDVLGCNEQLLAQVSSLRGAVGQQLQHPLHHLLGVFRHQVLGGGGG